MVCITMSGSDIMNGSLFVNHPVTRINSRVVTLKDRPMSNLLTRIIKTPVTPLLTKTQDILDSGRDVTVQDFPPRDKPLTVQLEITVDRTFDPNPIRVPFRETLNELGVNSNLTTMWHYRSASSFA
jgi:hypothetical protein